MRAARLLLRRTDLAGVLGAPTRAQRRLPAGASCRQRLFARSLHHPGFRLRGSTTSATRPFWCLLLWRTEGRESEYAEHLSYAFNYCADLVTILKSGSYKEKTGISIDGDDPDTEFAVLLTALRRVHFPIAYTEVSKLLDLEHDFDFYQVTLNELIFTILPVTMWWCRGTKPEEFDFPALREPKWWQPPIIGSAAASSLQFQ
ncbi:hypothetical protein CYMTET_26678 [Cymbomonas tetramitiformis]|uniref:Uncharacterized protein n=1 Tax=Cymbomonas tetramitiformis TaxID=36881 RepID=A0AAE0FSV3_9CHLO|nr:hypothetical protein CYMTET_26678 [Cymbomonas tetramitiformis]